MDLLASIARAGARVVDHAEGRRRELGIAQLLAEAERVASGLAARGFGRGARVAVLASPDSGFVASLLGALRAGATVVVLSPMSPRAEREASCARARVALFVDDGVRASGRDPVLPSPEDDALLLFTSGTTAAPKGARLTHANLGAHARVLHEAWRFGPADHLIHALPLHHLHGLGTSLLTALAAGATVELLPRFEPVLVWEAIARAPSGAVSGGVFMGVPTTIARLASAFEAADPSTQARWRAGAERLRLVTNGSAGLPPATAERWRRIAGVAPLERFGMTEIGVATTAPIDGPRVPGVSGRVVTGMQLRVVDESGAVAPPDVEGEIEVRGPGVFPGYDGEAAQAAFRDGWFRTGDAGVLDARGDLVVRGRLSVDVMKCGGYKLSALEIEAAIREHDAIEDVAVVGLPDPEWGDLPTAVVVVRRELAFDELRGFLRERIAPYKVPKRFVLRDALPRNGIGKVVKPALVAELSAR